MAYLAGFENRAGRKTHTGSNPVSSAMLQNKKMQFQISAGGIVYKKENNQILILVAQHSGHKGWVFPKGLIGDHVENEDKKETAIREVKEETGVSAKILKPLAPITYRYTFEGIKIKKTVYYYLMEYLDGDISNHDWEMEKVEWLPKEEVENRLTYESEKKVWREAWELI